jgi:hypothetical protein
MRSAFAVLREGARALAARELATKARDLAEKRVCDRCGTFSKPAFLCEGCPYPDGRENARCKDCLKRCVSCQKIVCAYCGIERTCRGRHCGGICFLCYEYDPRGCQLCGHETDYESAE